MIHGGMNSRNAFCRNFSLLTPFYVSNCRHLVRTDDDNGVDFSGDVGRRD